MTATNVRRPDMVRRKSLRATKEKVNGKIIWLFRKGSGFESLRSRFSALESTNNNATLIGQNERSWLANFSGQALTLLSKHFGKWQPLASVYCILA